MANELDQIDRKLLELLQRDGLQSMAELSKVIGVAPSTLNDRVKRLGRMGVVTGTHARLEPEAMGLGLLAFVYVGWSDSSVEDDFVSRMAAAPEVLECHHVTGAWTYLLKVRVADTRALEGFLSNLRRQVSGLQRIETQIVLSSPKETSALPTG